MLSTFLGGRADFRRLYTSGYMVRAGYANQLYDTGVRYYLENKLVSPGDLALPFDHPAYEALLYAPFSFLNYRAAYLTFLVFNVGLLGTIFWVLRPWTINLRDVYAWLPVALFLAFLPICAVLIQGQDSILLLLLLAAAYICLDRGREFPAGLLIGIGLFKFQLVLPIALLFLLWRRWRFVSGFALAGTVLGLISIWLVGLSQTIVYVQSLQSISIHLMSAADQFRFGLSPAAMPNLRGLLFGLSGGHLSNLWLQILTIVCSCVVLAWAARTIGAKQGTDLLLVAITVSGLVSYHLLIHDMSVLLLPVLVTMDRFIRAEASGTKNERFKVRAAALLFTAPLLMSWTPNYFFLAAIPMLIFLFALSRQTGVIPFRSNEPRLGWSNAI
jgi:Glycosyltransferase family 87